MIKRVNLVNYVLQEKPSAKPFVAHVDRMRKFYGDTPSCWQAELNTNHMQATCQEKKSSRKAHDYFSAWAEPDTRGQAISGPDEVSEAPCLLGRRSRLENERSDAHQPDKSAPYVPDFSLGHGQPDQTEAGCRDTQPMRRSGAAVTSSYPGGRRERHMKTSVVKAV